MTKDFPKSVFIREEGPREGFQMHSEVIPTKQKIALIDALANTGVKSMEITSFVRPDKVPQHADAVDVAEGINAKSDVRYRGLYLNQKGFLRAISCKNLNIEGAIPLAASDAFLQKNSNTTIDKTIRNIPGWLSLFDEHKVDLERVMLSMAFGSKEEGKIESNTVISIIEKVVNEIRSNGKELAEITLADTTGYGNPRSIERLVSECKSKWPDLIVGLHLHDTHGTGMANVYEGLRCGVSRFDSSVGGLGGCPFTKGAAGNVPTEDVAYLCEELGVSTGLNLKAYVECAKLAEQIIKKALPGKYKDNFN